MAWPYDDQSLIPSAPNYGAPPGVVQQLPPPPTVAPNLPPLALQGTPPASPASAPLGGLLGFTYGGSGPDVGGALASAGRSFLASTYGGKGDPGPVPAPPPAAAPAPPPAVAPSAVITAGGGGGGAPPALTQAQQATMTPAEIEYYNFNRSQAIAEANKRPTAGVFVKGGKVQSGEQIAGQVGASAETTKRYQDARARSMEAARQGTELEGNVGELDRFHAGVLAEQDQAYAKQAADLEKQRTEALTTARADIDAASKDVREGKYEPDRIWSNASTGQKVGTWIGAILTGIGQAAAGDRGENLAFKGLRETLDRDNINQQTVLKLKREKLNGAQLAYRDTFERFGSEAAAQNAAKLVQVQALKTQLAQEAERMRATTNAKQSSQDWFDGKPIVTLREEQAMAALEQKEAEYQFNLEREINGTVSKSFGFTQDRMVGGSAGPDPKKIAGYLSKNAELERGAVPKGGRADQAPALVVDGTPLAVAPGVSQATVDKVQGEVSTADKGLAAVAALSARAAQPGGMVPGDPAIGIGASALTGVFTNLSGSGAPSPAQEALIAAAVTPGPRQAAALQEVNRFLTHSKATSIRSTGAAR